MKAAHLAALLALVLSFAPLAFAQDSLDALTREREEQTGTAITILFDNSGSMKGEKLNQAKSAFRSWLENVPAEYKLSLITFEDTGRIVVPLGEHTRDRVLAVVAALEARTSTPICGALRLARTQIEQRRRDVTPYERQVVLVFTDGQETVDSRGIDGVREDIAALRQQTVEVVGVGFHGEGDYMNGVATRFTLANSAEELKQGLAKVDAEVSGMDDLVVSAADLAALKNFHAPSLAGLAIASADAGSEPSVPSDPPAAGAKTFRLKPGWVILAIFGWFMLRTLFKKKGPSATSRR